jgi:hypothetical protein
MARIGHRQTLEEMAWGGEVAGAFVCEPGYGALASLRMSSGGYRIEDGQRYLIATSGPAV